MPTDRARTSPVQRSLEALLQSSKLTDRLTEINTDLALEAADYRLPASVDSGRIHIASQGAVMPQETPQILAEVKPSTERPKGLAGKQARAALIFEISLYLGFGNLTNVPGSINTDKKKESVLDQAMQDFGEAVKRAVVDWSTGIVPTAGIGVNNIKVVTGQRKLYRLRASKSARAVKMLLTITMSQRKKWA